MAEELTNETAEDMAKNPSEHALYISRHSPTLKVKLGPPGERKVFQFRDGVLELTEQKYIEDADVQIASGALGQHAQKVDMARALEISARHMETRLSQNRAAQGTFSSESQAAIKQHQRMQQLTGSESPSVDAELLARMKDQLEGENQTSTEAVDLDALEKANADPEPEPKSEKPKTPFSSLSSASK